MGKFILSLVISVSISCFFLPLRVSSLPLVKSDCELEGSCKRVGDMMINTRARAGTKDYHWPNGTIPYDFHESVQNQTWKLLLIESDVAELNSYVCVDFRPRLANDSVGLRIFDNPDFPKECWSDVGFDPEFQMRKYHLKENESESNDWDDDDIPYQVTVIGDLCSRPYGIGQNKRTTKGTVMHELIHALGFFHTHASQDRDRYVKIHYENIPAEDWNQFDYAGNVSGKVIDNYGVPYDYQSIMHYPPNARGAPAGSITIEVKPPETAPFGVGDAREMGHECYLTSGDVLAINTKYERDAGCAKPTPRVEVKPPKAEFIDGRTIC